MSRPALSSRDVDVATLFQEFYVVPDFQPAFTWESDRVTRLLTDIDVECAAGGPSDYFLGTVVMCPGADRTWEVIDGGQRLTTLLLVLCAIRDRLIALGDNVDEELTAQISWRWVDVLGVEHSRSRVELPHDDGGDDLRLIAGVERASKTSPASPSAVRIRAAYAAARMFLEHELRDDPVEISRFYQYLSRSVVMVCVRTDNLSHALKLIETLNDVGRGGQTLALVENLVMKRTDVPNRVRLAEVWRDIEIEVGELPDTPLRFLRLFILSQYDVDEIGEDHVAGWFVRHAEKAGYARCPLAFATELLDAARAYRAFAAAEDPSGRRHEAIENCMRLLEGRSRSPLILLLAGRRLPPSLFDQFATEVEELCFVFAVTRESTRSFERACAHWAAIVRESAARESLADITRQFALAKSLRVTRVVRGLEGLWSETTSPTVREYVRRKLPEGAELARGGDTEALVRLASSTWHLGATPPPIAKAV